MPIFYELSELAAAQSRLRLGAAVKFIRYFDGRLHMRLAHKTIKEYLWKLKHLKGESALGP